MIVTDGRSSALASSNGPATEISNPFEKLLEPMTWATFLEQVWERQPCLITGRGPDHYADVLTSADLDAVICASASGTSGKPVTQLGLGAVNLVQYGEAGQTFKAIPRTTQGLPDLRYVYQEYAAGCSVSIDSLQRYWQPVAQFCNVLQQVLHHPIGAYLFLTPAGAQAYAPHYDPYDTFLLQIDGAKQWQVYEPLVSLPLASMQRPVQDEELGQPVLESRLEAGDLLYIPRGYIHRGLTADVSSLHLTLAVRAIRWVHVLEHAIRRASERDILLREAVPAGFLQSEAAAESMEQRFRDIVKTVFDDLPFAIVMRSLTKMFADHQQVPLDGHFLSLDRLGDIDANTVVKRRSGMLCTVSRTRELAMLWFSGSPVEAPLEIEPALRFIASSERFAVRELPDCLTENGKCVLVRRLVREGLLALEKASPPAEGAGGESRTFEHVQLQD